MWLAQFMIWGLAHLRQRFVHRRQGLHQSFCMEPLVQPCQHYQGCRQTQNCHCEKYHRVGRHLCQKLDHLPLLGDLGRSVGVVTSFHSDRARPRRSEQSVLSFIANRSSFLIDELLIGKLSETVVVHGNAPYDRPGFLVGHVIGNRTSLLCTKAPMRRIPNEISGHQLTSTSVPLDEEGPQPLLAGAS